MPRNPTTGVFTIAPNSFAPTPAFGDVIDPNDAATTWGDLSDGITDSIAKIVTPPVDNAVLRADGTTGGFAQGSVVTIDDDGVISGATWDGDILGIVSVLGYGADPTGVTSSSDAFAAAHAAGNYIFVPNGTYKLSTTQIWPVGKTWNISGLLSIDGGVTITNLGVVESGFNQIFSGSGSIVGMTFNRPEWWGATNLGIVGGHDDAPAINLAVASAQTANAFQGDRPRVVLSGGQGYLISSKITLSPTVNCPLEFGGVGIGTGGTTRIIVATVFADTAAIFIEGQSSSTDAIMNFWIHDFGIVAQAASANVSGFLLGSTGKNIGGLGRSLVENVTVTGLTTGVSATSNASVRLIEWRRFNVWLPATNNSKGFLLAPAVGGFVGDWVTHGVQVICSNTGGVTGQVGVHFKATAGTSGGVGGMHWHDTTTYYASKGIFLEAADNQQVGDIWFYSPQIEGGGIANGIDGIVMSATGGALARPQIYDVNLVAPWLNSLAGKSLTATASVLGTIQQLQQAGGFTTNSTSTPLELNNVLGGSFTGFTIRGSAGGLSKLIDISGATANVDVVGFDVNLSGTALPTNIVLISGTADNNTISGAAAEGQYGSAFASVTSSGTANQVIYMPGTVSNTGTGANVRATSPTLVTPTLGVASATSINKVAITAPASSATLTIPDGVTLTGPASSGTAMTLGNTETVTGIKTFGSAGAVGRLKIAGTTSGSTVLDATAVASGTITLPAATGTVALVASTFATVKKSTGSPFTTSGTYTPSAGMLFCIIECIGGGGGGGAAQGTVGAVYAGGGGGSGSYSRLIASAATIGASKTVTIGAGGAGGATTPANGSAGGDTSVGSLCIGKGGSGGLYGSAGQVGLGSAGGVAGTGDLTPIGGAGGNGGWCTSLVVQTPSGVGGQSYWGGGAASKAGAGGAGNAGGNYGGGGSGAYAYNTASAFAGGDGSAGVVFITEFCSA